MPNRKKAGIRDIAAQAGVSTTTVSYVLNQVEGKNISAETTERVLAAARRLNYTPNAAARLLRTGAAKNIAVRLTATFSIPRYYSLLEGIRACLDESGYHMILLDDRPQNGYPAYIEACLGAKADGILYVSSNSGDIPEQELALIRRGGIPLAAVDCMVGDGELSSVHYDYYASSSLRVEALHRQGVPRVVYLSPDTDHVKIDLRVRGILETAEKCGMSAEIVPFNTREYREDLRGKGRVTIEDIMDFPFDVKKAETAAFRLEPEAIEKLRELVYGTPGDTGILYSFPMVQSLINDFLYKRHLLGLREGSLPWYALAVNYVFPHYDTGYEAAAMLLEAIDGKSPRKRDFQPLIIPINPAIY